MRGAVVVGQPKRVIIALEKFTVTVGDVDTEQRSNGANGNKICSEADHRPDGELNL